MKLMIVEDNVGMRRLIKSVVSGIADEIVECEDGGEAVGVYSKFRPDWVLMDIRMPKVDGITATLDLISSFPEARICIVTDYGDTQTISEAYQAGAQGYVLKENLYSLREVISQSA